MTTFELMKQFAHSAAAVYEQLTDMPQYPKWMKNIDCVTVLARDGNMTKTRWEATLDGRKIMWTEEDTLDEAAHTITYRLIEGDLSEMAGSWRVADTDDGNCRVTLQVSFSFGIPMMAMFIEPILKRKLEENSHMLLDGIEAYLNTK